MSENVGSGLVINGPPDDLRTKEEREADREFDRMESGFIGYVRGQVALKFWKFGCIKLFLAE